MELINKQRTVITTGDLMLVLVPGFNIVYLVQFEGFIY